MKFLSIIGTAREKRRTVRVVKCLKAKLENQNHEVEVFDPKESPIPHLKERRHTTENPDSNIEKLGQKIEEADSIILVTPEYNHSYPGTLKNILDHFYPEYEDKLFGYVTTSAGGFGGIRQLPDLQKLTLAFNAIPGPHLPISKIQDTIDEEGNVIDEEYSERLDSYIDDLITETEKYKDI